MGQVSEDELSALMCEEAEDVFCEGVSSRFPEIMAAGTHSPGGPNGIIRSQSFAGFSTLQERRSRCNSFMGNSVVQKKPPAKAKKSHAVGHKGNSGGGARESKPRRVEEVYGALKQGLDEYLEAHQSELDKLTLLMKDMRRNSRLGVLYDLDKQIKTIERYVRRLEFHISKVDELYEAFCIQRRLRDGASKMKAAFSDLPSTKGTRESLNEVSRRYKEYNENMCTFEGELENLLGEFHITMKGLAGFARLCPGDQYEIFMRYGRQRWKLKGKIEASSTQSWDSEEMVFLPLITDLISIKVSELKGLATHVLVGSVICETKDLFTARPQVVAVDVNDLGTIKLNLEVTWFPFDAEDLTLSSGNLSKASALQRRVSVYSQGTPETPTFQDNTFFSTLRDDLFENGGGAECKRLSFTFTDIPQASPTPAQSNPEITVTPPETVEEREGEHALQADESTSISLASEASEWEQQDDSSPPPHQDPPIAMATKEGFLDREVSDALLRDEASDLKPVELDTDEGCLTRQLVKRLTSAEAPPPPDCSLEEAIQGLLLRLDGLNKRGPELQELEQEVMRLEDLLKCRAPPHRSRSSSLSLTVESALESFDFLNTSDFDDDDTGDDALPRSVFFDMETERNGPGQHPEARGHLSEALTEDTGVGNSVAGSPLPLTTGHESLDTAIIIHLQYCSHLVQLLSTGRLPSQHQSHLHKLSTQTRLLEELAEISLERLAAIGSAAEVLPGLAENPTLLDLWLECSGSIGLFHTTVEQTVKHLHRRYGPVLQERHPEAADTAVWLVVNGMLDRSEPTSCPWSTTHNLLTVFQFHSYAAARDLQDMQEHLLHMAREVTFEEALRSSDPQSVLRELEEEAPPPTALQPRRETLTAVASLLTSDDLQVSKAAGAFLSSAASNVAFRSKAVDFYTQALSEDDEEALRSACAALMSLQAVESIGTVVSLCDSADEEIRQVAIETLLSLGEEGRLAYEQLDEVPRELVRLGTRIGNAVTTAF